MRYLLFNRLCNSLGKAGAKKNNKENVKYYCTDFILDVVRMYYVYVLM